MRLFELWTWASESPLRVLTLILTAERTGWNHPLIERSSTHLQHVL